MPQGTDVYVYIMKIIILLILFYIKFVECFLSLLTHTQLLPPSIQPANKVTNLYLPQHTDV